MTTFDSRVVQEAADRLHTARQTGTPCAPIRDLLPEDSLEAGYAVQNYNTERALSSGRKLVGRKIGLTSAAVQGQLGVNQPDYGMLYSDMGLFDSEEVPVQDMLQPKVEAELAFVLGKDLEGEVTPARVLGAIEYAVAAIEIVDSAVANWDIKILDTVADNASSGRYVLGTQPKKLGDFDPWLCGMVMERRGEPVATGVGAACLGNPLTATLWLAKKMAQVDRPLRAGDVVLSGALGPLVPVAPGDVFETRINHVGTVRAVFSKES